MATLPASPWIQETTEATFQRDVMERSKTVLVIVDFWATWCQPCRLLGPMLQRLALEYQGKFVLVKARMEDLPEVSALLNVQAIPTVFAVRNGKIVDQFVGLLPEATLRAWLKPFLPTPDEELVSRAKTLEIDSPKEAETLYRQAIELAPNRSEGRVGLARVLLAQDRVDECEQLLDHLASANLLDAEGRRVRAAVTLRQAARLGHGVQECRAAVQADPRNRTEELNLAWAMAAAGQYQEALELALRLVREDRAGVGGSAQELMVQLFHFLGADDPRTGEYRRKLATVLW